MEYHDEIRLGRRPVNSLKSRRDRLHARPRVSYPDRPMSTKGTGAAAMNILRGFPNIIHQIPSQLCVGMRVAGDSSWRPQRNRSDTNRPRPKLCLIQNQDVR